MGEPSETLNNDYDDVANWMAIAKKVDGRTAKQCRDRWINTLRPGLTKGKWTTAEEIMIKTFHQH